MTAKVMSFVKVGISFTDISSISSSKDVINTTGADTSFAFGGFSPANPTVPGSKSNLDSLNDNVQRLFQEQRLRSFEFLNKSSNKDEHWSSIDLDELFPKIPGQLMLGVDYHQGFNTQFNNSTTPEFVFGVEWRPI